MCRRHIDLLGALLVGVGLDKYCHAILMMVAIDGTPALLKANTI
jgi:hypothetical protein